MLPRTLLTRLFLMLALLMAISAIAWTTIISLTEREPHARQFAQMLTSVANLTRAAVVAAAPERRQDLLAELSKQEGIRIDLADDNEKIEPQPDDPVLARTLTYLRASLGPDTQLVSQRNGESALFLRISIEGDGYWIVMPRGRFNRQFRSFQWLGWGILAAGLALLAAGVFVSRVTKPLRDLAAAAREIGAGRHPPPLAADGPEELATVAGAFNQMNADLMQLDQDRALILAGISHDLRTPLTRLRMGAEMVSAEDAMRQGMMDDIEDIDRTIGQFLDFARTDGGEPEEPTDLVALIEEIMPQYQRRGATVSARYDGAVTASVRAKALRRAICNLIDNALRHAGDSSPVDISLAGADGTVRIAVCDRGPGIPVHEIERLKRPFTRLDTARGNAMGAGLGLAIVDRVCRQHGGTLELNTRPGGGLEAVVRFPRK